jgi:DNA-binding NarL/FixJ family response regulator
VKGEGSPSCRIVICDDQPGFRQILTIVFELEPDFAVVGEAEDGHGAVELAGELRPDVLVLDLAMPAMDGIEALPRILDASPETQVVVVTGFGSSRIRQRALDAGACRFIEKGTDVEAIVRQIREICPEAA